MRRHGRRRCLHRRWSIALAIMVLMPFGANAQTTQAAAPETQRLKPAELDQLVAPIALYPDTLLAEVLMASAYPLDIVQAERWVQANKNLTGDQLKAAVDKQPWDESVKSLVATPSVLEMMSTKLDWTEKLGDAVVAQQADVMDAIQRLRAKAQGNNKLTSIKSRTSAYSKRKVGRSLPSNRRTPIQFMCRTMIRASSTVTGRIPSIRHITSARPATSLRALLRPELRSAPDTRLAVGRRAAAIGAVESIGAGTISSSIGGSAAATTLATNGSPGSSIVREPAAAGNS
jgi:hypothetical protein